MAHLCACGWPRCSQHGEHLPCSVCWAERLDAAIDSIGPGLGIVALIVGSWLLAGLGGAL